jgi:hypothetical protein
MGANDYNSDFGCTPSQYHGQLIRLWNALGPIKNQANEDVFTLAIRAIAETEAKPSRREIAARAMQGMLADPDIHERFEVIADEAVRAADALIARLNADPVAEGVNLLPMYSRELDEGLDNDQDRGVSR